MSTYLSNVLNKILDNHTKINIILGSGNIGSDYSRHKDDYFLAIGGECDIKKEDMFCIDKKFEDNITQNFIKFIIHKIHKITIDLSVCIDFNYKDIIFIIDYNTELFIPLRNIYINTKEFMNNNLLQYPDNKLYNYIKNCQTNICLEDLYNYKQPIYTEILNTFFTELLLNNIQYSINTNSDFKYPIKKYNDKSIDKKLKEMLYIHMIKI